LAAAASVILMKSKKKILIAIFVLFVAQPSVARAARFENAWSLGLPLFSGATSGYVVPAYGFLLGFSTAALTSKTFNIVNAFDVGLGVGGTQFGSVGSAYNLIFGMYDLGLRINLMKKMLQPYFSFGPTLGFFAANLTSPPATQSTNQASLKYGYWLAAGFDWYKDDAGRGSSSAWGLELTYFNYLASPGLFEFPAGRLGVRGIKFEVHFILAPSK